MGKFDLDERCLRLELTTGCAHRQFGCSLRTQKYKQDFERKLRLSSLRAQTLISAH